MLSGTNSISRQDSGVYLPDGQDLIAPSRAGNCEQRLARIIAEAQDVSSISTEIEAQVEDWRSEYCISGKRANLIRPLNIRPRMRVLEIGSGCGAISRYLGEQGAEVDAVEADWGSALIAASRCRGMDNVRVVCANLNELKLPDDCYDVVILIEFAEYAASYGSQGQADSDPASALLAALKRTLRNNGMLVAAVANRSGLKYVLGAHEEHSGRRYAGIHGHHGKGSASVRSLNEWEALWTGAGFFAMELLLPFPDHRVPTVTLSAAYAAGNPYAFAHIEGLKSRDYVMPLHTGEIEPMFWQSAGANGTISQFANSFLFLLGDDEDVLSRSANFDFVHFPDFRRNSRFSVITRKGRGSDAVERVRLEPSAAQTVGMVTQLLRDEAYVTGNLLSVEWSRSLAIDPWGRKFGQLLKAYFDYLGRETLSIDLVPGNVVVTPDGEYRSFDQEWIVSCALVREYVLFRALMLFAHRHRPVLGEFARRHSIHTVRDFVRFGFRQLGLDATGLMDGFISLESEFQAEVNANDTTGLVEDFLSVRMDEPALVSPICAKLYWSTPGQGYSEENSAAVTSYPGEELATLIFELPRQVSAVTHFRFDPCDEWSGEDVGFLRVSRIGVEAEVNGERSDIFSLAGEEAIAASAKLSGMVFEKARFGEVFAVLNYEPEVEFEMPAAAAADACGYRVSVECSHIRSREYRLVRDRYLVEEQNLRNELAELAARNEKLECELHGIRGSRLWKAASRYRSIREKLA